MAGILDFLSPALNVATNAVATNEGAQVNAAKEREKRVADALQRTRQDREDALKQALGQAQIGNYQSEAQKRQYDMDHPKPTKPNLSAPIIGPKGEVQLVNEDDPTHPIKVPGIQGKIEYPPKYVSEPNGQNDDKRSAYVLRRIQYLTKPQTDPMTKLQSPGLSLDEANRQAELEWNTAGGHHTAPAAIPMKQPSVQNTSQADYDEAANLYQQALKQPGVDPNHVREVYDAAVKAIAKKHGQIK